MPERKENVSSDFEIHYASFRSEGLDLSSMETAYHPPAYKGFVPV